MSIVYDHSSVDLSIAYCHSCEEAVQNKKAAGSCAVRKGGEKESHGGVRRRSLSLPGLSAAAAKKALRSARGLRGEPAL